WAKAEEHYLQAIALGERLAGEFPTLTPYRRELAMTYASLASALRQTGRAAEAETSGRRALDLFARLATEDPKSPYYRDCESTARLDLAALLAHRDPDAAQALYQRALDIKIQLADEYPAVPEYRHQQADIHNSLGVLLAERRERTAAGEHFRQAHK